MNEYKILFKDEHAFSWYNDGKIFVKGYGWFNGEYFEKESNCM